MITNQPEFSALNEMIAAAHDAPALPAIPVQAASADLIPINRESGKPSVNARDLHAFLEVGSEFRNWIKNRIADFGFIENVDFSTAVEKSRGGERKDYFVSLDMAKELSMVERTDKGKQARQYFIACEKKLKDQPSPSALPSYPEALRLYAAEIEKTAMLETAVSELTPKADALDRIADADGQLNITQAAKVLQVSPKWLFSYLNVNGWTYRCQSTGAWVPYQGRIKSGVMSARVHTLTNQMTGEEMLKHQAYITPKGIAALSKFISTPSAP